VVDARGMIGRIYIAGQRTSWVILLTDLNSRIPVTIAPASAKGGTIQAIMTGDNTATPTLDMVSHTVTLHAGDQVTSSGDGGLLPAGLPVGTVVEDGSGGWRVALLADADSSQDVEILNFARAPEALPPTAQLPVEAAGLKPEAPVPPPPPVSPTAPTGTAPAPMPVKPVAAKPATAAAPADGENMDR
jgi:rod shape-determining protein MreC